jgi:hypothetical protein
VVGCAGEILCRSNHAAAVPMIADFGDSGGLLVDGAYC